MDWILLLGLTTFVIVVAFLLWTRQSTKRHQETGGRTSGLGGPNDPLSGATAGLRSAEDMRAGLNVAAARDAEPVLDAKIGPNFQPGTGH